MRKFGKLEWAIVAAGAILVPLNWSGLVSNIVAVVIIGVLGAIYWLGR